MHDGKLRDGKLIWGSYEHGHDLSTIFEWYLELDIRNKIEKCVGIISGSDYQAPRISPVVYENEFITLLLSSFGLYEFNVLSAHCIPVSIVW